MKKIFSLILMLFAVASTAYAAEPSDLIGHWEGWSHTYPQKEQEGLSMTFWEENGKVVGLEEAYSMPGENNIPYMKYTVEVTVEGDKYLIHQKNWISKQPSGWSLGEPKYLTLTSNVLQGYHTRQDYPTMLFKDNESYSIIYGSVFNNHKYEVFDESLTWYEAKAKCEEMGGHLVTISSRAENDFVMSLVKEKEKNLFWLGCYSENDKWNWVDGTEFSYNNWAYNEPNDSGGNEMFGHLFRIDYDYYDSGSDDHNAGEWNDLANAGDTSGYALKHMGYICEWETWSDSAEWATPELQKAAEYELIPDVLVSKDMTKPITRGEFAAVAVKLFEAMTDGKAVMASECKFEDIADDENRNYILKAYNIGAVNGISETSFAPTVLLEREQLAAMLARVYKRSEWADWTLENDEKYTINYSGVQKFADDEFISDWAKPSVYFMVKYKVLSGIGDNKFAPRNTTTAEEAENYANATREQAVVMSLRSFENLKPEE